MHNILRIIFLVLAIVFQVHAEPLGVSARHQRLAEGAERRRQRHHRQRHDDLVVEEETVLAGNSKRNHGLDHEEKSCDDGYKGRSEGDREWKNWTAGIPTSDVNRAARFLSLC